MKNNINNNYKDKLAIIKNGLNIAKDTLKKPGLFKFQVHDFTIKFEINLKKLKKNH